MQPDSVAVLLLTLPHTHTYTVCSLSPCPAG
jgi:hypothetical protein